MKELVSIGGWGSLEIFVQNYKITQITKREICKTNYGLKKYQLNKKVS